ncbi:MAG: efflux RND transporter periplasmic adaptor subunit [Arenimonas sp.]
MKNSNAFIRPFLFAMVFGTLVLSGCKGGKEADADAKTDEKAKTEQAEDQTGKDGKDGEKKPEAVPVEVVSVARKPISASYSGTANLEAPGESQVVAKTSGVMVQLLAEEGQIVHKGQVLARLDGDRVRLEAQRSAATVHKLENNYRRSQELRAQKLVSADADEQIRYELETARANLALAQLELSYTNIVAPISGVVAQRMVKPGNLISLNAPVFRIVDNSHLEAVLNVPEREMSVLRQGMPLRMIVDAIPGNVFEGKVDRVSPVIDSGTGTFRVVCAFVGNDKLRPGMFGRIEVVFDQRDNVLTMPRIALLEDEGESAVFVVRGNKAARVPVKLGYANGEYAEILSGLKDGDRVITAGKVAVRDGTEIQILGDKTVKPADGVAKK